MKASSVLRSLSTPFVLSHFQCDDHIRYTYSTNSSKPLMDFSLEDKILSINMESIVQIHLQIPFEFRFG